jgi:hypothetical protein
MRAFGGDIQFVESLPLVKTVFRVNLPVTEDVQEVAA